MAAALAIHPASGDITAKLDTCRISVTGAEVNNADGTQKRYRIRFTPPAEAADLIGSGYSYLFNVSSTGEHVYNGFIFPLAGSWSVRLHDEEGDDDEATLAVTVN